MEYTSKARITKYGNGFLVEIGKDAAVHESCESVAKTFFDGFTQFLQSIDDRSVVTVETKTKKE